MSRLITLTITTLQSNIRMRHRNSANKDVERRLPNYLINRRRIDDLSETGRIDIINVSASREREKKGGKELPGFSHASRIAQQSFFLSFAFLRVEKMLLWREVEKKEKERERKKERKRERKRATLQNNFSKG